MDQLTACTLAKHLYARDPGLLPIAMTEATWNGGCKCNLEDSPWIVVTTTELIYRAVPDNMNLDEPIAELGD